MCDKYITVDYFFYKYNQTIISFLLKNAYYTTFLQYILVTKCFHLSCFHE